MFVLTEAVIGAFIAYALMVAAYFLSRQRVVHSSVMVANMLFDIGMPFYLVMTRDWMKMLVDNGDIMSFGVWTHFGLIITLYFLYYAQVRSGIALWKGDMSVRGEHHAQARGILLVRGLVVVSGAWLAEPLE